MIISKTAAVISTPAGYFSCFLIADFFHLERIYVHSRIFPLDFLVSSSWPHEMHILEDSVLHLSFIPLLGSVREDVLYKHMTLRAH